MTPRAKKLFEEAVTNYGIGNDGFERKYVTIFIFSTPANDAGTLPQLPLDNLADSYYTLYQLNFYELYGTCNDDYINHINVDLAIADNNTPSFKCFSIPKEAQTVFKAILKAADYIGPSYMQDQHVRICFHNEKVIQSCGEFADPTPLIEKICNHPSKCPQQDTPDTTKEEQIRMKKRRFLPPLEPISIQFSPHDNENLKMLLTTTPANPASDSLTEFDKLVQKTLEPNLTRGEIDECNVADLSHLFEKLEIFENKKSVNI